MHSKILTLLPLAALLASCGGGGKDLSEIKDATPADSMMYYLGEMQAANYWQDAETDTLLRSEAAKKEFIRGLKDGINMANDKSAFNKGLQLGVRLSVRLNEFKDRYGENFSGDVLAASVENCLLNEKDFSLSETQRAYYNIKDRLELRAATNELADAKEELAKKGGEMGFEMLSDTLFVNPVTPAGAGPRFKEGDRVAVEVTASTLDGKEIVTRQFPDSVTLGEGRVPLVVRYAIYTMTDGQTCRFMTTPRTLFGKRYAIYRLPSDEPVIFTVKASR